MQTSSIMRFGTVGTPISTPKKPGGSVGAIQRLREINLDALELGWVQSVRISEEKCKEINLVSQKLNIFISVHAPYFINLNADDIEWPKSRKRLMDAAFFGNLTGATDIIFHPGSYFGQQPADVLKIAIPRLQSCVQDLRSEGNLVYLRPETMGKQAMLGSLLDTLILSKEIDGVLPCLDFAHLHARPGDGSMNSKNEWISVLDQYQKYLGTDSIMHLHIHMSGIEYTSKGEKNHLPLRESDFQLLSFLETLNNYNCSGRILCESPILEEDALYMKDVWEKI